VALEEALRRLQPSH